MCKGFIKRYADYLGLDGERLSRRASAAAIGQNAPCAQLRELLLSASPAFALRPSPPLGPLMWC
jgi:cytoskeletal protein RodZ